MKNKVKKKQHGAVLRGEGTGRNVTKISALIAIL
jgi:hypothetical protein